MLRIWGQGGGIWRRQSRRGSTSQEATADPARGGNQRGIQRRQDPTEAEQRILGLGIGTGAGTNSSTSRGSGREEEREERKAATAAEGQQQWPEGGGESLSLKQ